MHSQLEVKELVERLVEGVINYVFSKQDQGDCIENEQSKD